LGVVLAGVGCGRVAFDPLGDGAPNSKDTAPDPSLVLWFPFENGMTEAISGVAATCLNFCPQVIPGRNGNVLRFNGGNGEGAMLPDTGVTRLQAFTLALWVNKDSDGEWSYFAKTFAAATTAYNSWQVEDHASKQLGFTTHNAGRHDVLYTTDASPSMWHHIAMSFDGATKRIYIDGGSVMQIGEPDPVQYDTGDILLGCDINNQVIVYPYFGSIDDVRVYSRVLSDSEIAALAR
jgi:hypothetical protein